MGDDGGERMLCLWRGLSGQVVQVTVKDGTEWEGVIEYKESATIAVKLYHARLRRYQGVREGTRNTDHHKVLELSSAEILSVSGMAEVGKAKSIHEGAGGITANQLERELQPWMADCTMPSGDLEGDSHQVGEWDQFAANAKRHNYKSTYHEDFYTTKLDREGLTKDQVKEAERLAAEIEGAGKGQHDHASWADEEYDEEALHSAVVRETDKVSHGMMMRGQNSYRPPHQRLSEVAPNATLRPAAPSARAGSRSPAGRPSQPQSLETAKPAEPAQLPQRAAIPKDCYKPDQQPSLAAKPTNAAAQFAVLPQRTTGVRGAARAANRVQYPPKTKEQEIADLKRFAAQPISRKKADEKSEEKSPAVTASKDPATSEEGVDTPSSAAKKKLNPGAVPFKPTDSDLAEEEAAKSEPAEKVPFTEPEWKPALSDRATQNHTKFINKLIADGIKERITKLKHQKANSKDRPGETERIIPGDAEPFNSEFLSEEQLKQNEKYFWWEEFDQVKPEAPQPGSPQHIGGGPPQQPGAAPAGNAPYPQHEHHQQHQYPQHSHHHHQHHHYRQEGPHQGYQGAPPQQHGAPPQGGAYQGGQQHHDGRASPQYQGGGYPPGQQGGNWNQQQPQYSQQPHQHHHHHHHHHHQQHSHHHQHQQYQQHQHQGQGYSQGGQQGGYQGSGYSQGGQYQGYGQQSNSQSMYQGGPQGAPGHQGAPRNYPSGYGPGGQQGGYNQQGGPGMYGGQQGGHPQQGHYGGPHGSDPNAGMQQPHHQGGGYNQQYGQGQSGGPNMQGGAQGGYRQGYYQNQQHGMMEGGEMMHGGYGQQQGMPQGHMGQGRRGMQQGGVMQRR
eukprot:TRINITY_DN5872_c0_g2_i2.p1 TRINITY_DN5872_c0_g2~~TRINITY_DN5872_c0_g2_i2.p1  ORF type:complete len:838 (+),score=296.49 TRINITY_DN5872_c0_g2_i2:88-2601(+)